MKLEKWGQCNVDDSRNNNNNNRMSSNNNDDGKNTAARYGNPLGRPMRGMYMEFWNVFEN